MVCSVAGITSDANVLTNELRLIGQRYLLQYGESIPCEQLVSWLCDIKQAYTQYGGTVFSLKQNYFIYLPKLVHIFSIYLFNTLHRVPARITKNFILIFCKWIILVRYPQKLKETFLVVCHLFCNFLRL